MIFRLKQLLLCSILLCCIACLDQNDERDKYSLEFTQVMSPFDASLRGVATYGDSICWLSGAKGSICKSIDGGASWKAVKAPDNDSLDFRDLAILDQNTILLMSAGFPCRIYKTVNAGDSWRLVYENKDSSSFLNAIAFKNDTEGLAFGDRLGNRHLLLQTNDAGKNWSRIEDKYLPKPLDIENGFAASGASIAYMQHGSLIGLGGEKVRIFFKGDSEIWQAKETNTPVIGPASGLYALAAGQGKVIGIGGDYTLADSSHQAVIIDQNFTIRLSKSRLSGYRSGIAYSSKSKTWTAVGTNGLDLSFDGDYWKKVGDLNLNTIAYFKNSNRGIAASGKGEIFQIKLIANK